VSYCLSVHLPVIHSVISLSYLPAKILYSTIIISSLIVLYFKVGNFSFRNLSSWHNFLTIKTNLVARFYTFSNFSIKDWWWGFHTLTAYSKCCIKCHKMDSHAQYNRAYSLSVLCAWFWKSCCNIKECLRVELCRVLLYNNCLAYIVYALPPWGGFLSAELTGRINAFFRCVKRFGYIDVAETYSRGGSRNFIWGPRGAEGARIEAPQAPRGGRGCPPPHRGKGLGGGCATSPEFFIKWPVLVDSDVLHVLLIVVVKLETCT